MENTAHNNPSPSPASFTRRKVGVPPIIKPFVYGSISQYLNKRATDSNTHEWTGVDGEDLSYFIKQVHFILHSSFANNDRVVAQHPFELSATGWGEFEMKIRIVFRDPSERPVEFSHFLRLYPPGPLKALSDQPVVSEFYDEFIFNEPTEGFYEILTKSNMQYPPILSPYAKYYTKFSEEANLNQLMAINNYVEEQIKVLRTKLLEVDEREKKINENHNIIK